MADPWVVFVEGKSDKAFICCLGQFLGIGNVEVQRIGGGVHHLKNIVGLIQKHHDAGNRIAILLNAPALDPLKQFLRDLAN